MIKGIGVDICDLRRLNHLDQLAKKILHVDEFSLYLSKDNDKAKEAAKRAISSPLLEVSVAGAKDAIINVTGGPNISLYDANIALETITQEVGDDINTYLGIAINENLDDEIIVTVIATGFEEEKEEVTVQPSVARPLGEEPQTFESYDDDEDDDDGFPPAFIKNRRI